MAGRPLARGSKSTNWISSPGWARCGPSPRRRPPTRCTATPARLTRIWNTVRTHGASALPRRADVPRDADASSACRSTCRPSSALAPPRTTRRLPVNYWLPPSAEERRAGFYVCNEMLQLMEDVFLDFDLDQYHDHIDNRGWMNLFQHWAWSGMLCATWAMTGSMFDPRFQRFCRSHLDLRPGTPGVATAAPVLAAVGRRVAGAGRRRHGRRQGRVAGDGRLELLGGRARRQVPARHAPRVAEPVSRSSSRWRARGARTATRSSSTSDT